MYKYILDNRFKKGTVNKKLKYMRNMDNIQIGIDSTDHIVFICNKCKNPCEVKKVYSENGYYDGIDKPKDVCTWVTMECDACETIGQRKFYWKEDGKFCNKRTYTKGGKNLEMVTDLEKFLYHMLIDHVSKEAISDYWSKYGNHGGNNQ